MQKPLSPSCDRNKEPILKVLKDVIDQHDHRLLEVGSGTGQHAVFLAPHFPNTTWTTSDVQTNHEGIEMWLGEADQPNIEGPVAFEIGSDAFPQGGYDIIFTANTFHIMAIEKVYLLIDLLGKHLKSKAQVIIYGPFNYHGDYTSESNAEFDKWLYDRDPLSAIRHFEDINAAFEKSGFALAHDYEMPANNRILVFRKP